MNTAIGKIPPGQDKPKPYVPQAPPDHKKYDPPKPLPLIQADDGE